MRFAYNLVMSDIITGVRQAIQDLIAPDFKALQMKVVAMSRQIEVQHEAVMKTVEALRAEMRSEFAAVEAKNQLEVFRQVSPLRERINVVEQGRGRKFRE